MSYLPRILLCGDLASFRKVAGEMAVEIVGKIAFTGSPERGEDFHRKFRCKHQFAGVIEYRSDAGIKRSAASGVL